MADVYTIRAEDQVSGPARQMSVAYDRVALAAQALSNVMQTGDRVSIRSAQSMLSWARAELSAQKAAVSAGQAVSRLTPKVQQTAVVAEKAKTSTKGFSYALAGLANAASNAAFNLAGKLASGLFDVGKELYSTAELASRTKLGFKTLFGGVAEGEAATKKAIELSRQYGISIESVAKAVTMFKGANFAMPEIEGLIQLGADMKALGSTPEQIDSAMLAFRKIQSQGYLQGDELNMLSEAGVAVDKVYTHLQTTLGKTRAEIVKMQGNRQLAAGPVLNAVAESILDTAGSKKFGEVGQRAANETIGGITDRLKANLGDDLFESVLAAEPSLVKGMQAILGGALGADGDTLKEKLTGALVKVGDGLEQIGPQIPGFVKNLEALVEVLSNLASVLQIVTGPFKAAGEAIGSLFGAQGTAKLTPEAQARDEQFRNGLPSALEPGSDEAEAWMKKAQNAASNSLDPGDSWTLGKNWTEGLANGITSGAPSVGAAAGAAAQSIIDEHKDATQTHSPSRVGFELGENWTEGIALGIDEQADMAARASATVADQVLAESGAMGSKGALAAGQAAGDSFSRASTGGSSIGAVHFDVHLGGGGAGEDAVQQLRDFVELELAALLERAVEGSGA